MKTAITVRVDTDLLAEAKRCARLETRLVERGLATELGGKAEIAFRTEGVVCKITASLEGSR